MTIGNRIRRARQIRGLTQGELADQLGITKQAISQFEKDQVRVSDEQLRRISRILKKPLPYFNPESSADIQKEDISKANLGKKIKMARIDLEMSRADLAKMTNSSVAAIGRWEANERTPKADIMKMISTALKKPIEYFLSGGNGSSISEQTGVIQVKSIRYIPLCGDVKAGQPLHGESPPIDGYLPLPAEITAGKTISCAFKVISDSMEPGIKIGQYVLISKEHVVKDGDIALVYIRDEGTVLKRIRFSDNRVELISDNKKYRVKIFKHDEVHILGKVVGSVNYQI
jgi:transcriptional regulator with XRE-family HTH domain